MFKYAVLALSISVLVGCSSTGKSYDSIYDDVAYTYDHTLNRSVVKGPDEILKYNAKQEFELFKYNMVIEEGNTFVNLFLKYSDNIPRSFTHVIDTTGRVYPFEKHEKVIIDCGVSGSVSSGVCDYSDVITFKVPDDRQSQFILVGRQGYNAAFKVNKEYVAVMSDVSYRLKTPRSDADELRVKKNTLLTAAPKPLEQKSVAQPQPIAQPAQTYQPVVKTVPVQKPLNTTPVNNGSYVDQYKTVETCKCSSSPQSSSTITSVKTTTVKKPAPVAVVKPIVKPAVLTPVKQTLTPVAKDPFCSGMVFKNCSTINSCREAYDQLACGNKKLDPANKGMPCPNVCKL